MVLTREAPPTPPRRARRARRNPLGAVAVGLVIAANAVLWMCWPLVVEAVAYYL